MKLLLEHCLPFVVSNFSVSSNSIVTSACSSLSTSFLKSISGFWIDDGMLSFLLPILPNCCVRVIIKILVIFVFLKSCVLRKYAFGTRVSILTASYFIASFESLRISLPKTLWSCLFFSESNSFENFCVNCFQSDLKSIARTENHF